MVTDQTSAHDALNGYVPGGMKYEEALDLRKKIRHLCETFYGVNEAHCEAMVEMQKRGAVVFDYGNNLRGQARAADFRMHLLTPFHYLYSPIILQGRGPFRWAALSGDQRTLQDRRGSS